MDTWRASLAAVRLPNTLLVAGDVDAGALDLTHAHPSGLATLMAGRPARLSSLVREPEALAAAQQRVHAIRSTAGILALDRGIHAGYLAAGLARWRGIAAERRPGNGPPLQEALSAPVLLRRCTLRPHGSGHEDFDLDLDAAAVMNPLLLHRLAADHEVVVDGLALAELAFGPDGFNPEPVFDALARSCGNVPGFRIEPALLVGTFTAGSGQLLADLDLSAPAVRTHRVLGPGLESGSPEPPEPLPPVPEEIVDSPAPSGLVLDLDPQQRSAIDSALDGRDVVIEGPAGSGLTQTLAAAVGALVGQGKRVLVLTPHRGIADAFVARLAAAGLGDMVLNLHDGATDRAGILAGLAGSLEVAMASGPSADRSEPSAAELAARRAADRVIGTPDTSLAARFATVREGLLDAGDALHEVHDPWGVSAYQAMVALADLMNGDNAPRTTVRLPLEVTTRLDRDAREGLRDDLGRAAVEGGFSLTRLDTRWLDARVTTLDQAGHVLEAAAQAREALSSASAAMSAVAESAGIPASEQVGSWRPQLDLLLGIRDVLDVMLPAVYEQSLTDLIEATAPHGRNRGSGSREPLSRMARRSLRRRAHLLVRPGVQVPDLHDLLVRAQRQREQWWEINEGGGWPRVPTGLAAADVAVRALEIPLATVRDSLVGTPTPDLFTLPLDKLAQRLADLASDEAGMLAQPARTVLLDRLREAGLGDLITDLQERKVGQDEAGAELELAWWTSVLESVIRADPRLARYEPGAHRRWAAQLREIDRDLRVRGLAHIRDRIARNTGETVVREEVQTRWLRAEVHRGHRSEWPADLFRRAMDVVGAMRPVWVMSPDTVARVLPPAVVAEPVVDVVVVDDAGQVAMPEAAATIARGTQLLVAGDRRRLPPAIGRPSVLEFVGGLLPIHRLRRDHRTRDGRLLAPLLVELDIDNGWRPDPASVNEPDPVDPSSPREDPAPTDPSGAGRGEGGPAGTVEVPPGDESDARDASGGDPPPDHVDFPSVEDPTEVDTLPLDDRWRVVPGAEASPSLLAHLVDPGPGVPAPGEDIEVSPSAEVARVVNLVAEHAKRRPGESLLVVTLGARHAQRIEEGLRLAVVHDRDLATWLDLHWTGQVAEPFLVRPVHRIAGLERDTVILSVGIAKRPARSVTSGFGVLDGRYGRACLRAALTRGRRRVLVVSSFTADDLPFGPAVSELSPGMRLLRDVLSRAVDAAEVAVPGSPVDTGSQPARRVGEPADALVEDLRRRLEESGMPVVAGLPAADRPLDLAIGDPLEPGRYLVAVELDGPGYAACRSVRQRDRFRAESFERAGWRYLRVSAMDLFCDPIGEVDRIRDAWRAAGGLPATVVPSVALPKSPAVRGPWPSQISTGLPVSTYSARELDAVGRWVSSDGRTRSRDQLAIEIRTSLGLPADDLRTLEAVAEAAARVTDRLTVAPGGRP
jgi:hypothetical protein